MRDKREKIVGLTIDVMKIVQEIPLRDFKPWSGAKDTFEALTGEELDDLEYVLEYIYPDGMDEVQLNNILWFEWKWIAEVLEIDLEDRF